MLTVKHIDPASNSEKVHHAASVTYKHRHKHQDGSWSAAAVAIENARGEETHLGSWGKFFVMNEAGKTVASYDLGGELSNASSGITITGALCVATSGTASPPVYSGTTSNPAPAAT